MCGGAGARVPMAAMQPGRIPLYLMNGNVLRVAHPGQCHVEEDEDMVDCGLQFLQVLSLLLLLCLAPLTYTLLLCLLLSVFHFSFCVLVA